MQLGERRAKKVITTHAGISKSSGSEVTYSLLSPRFMQGHLNKSCGWYHITEIALTKAHKI